MLNKKERTLEMYKTAGACMRLLYDLAMETCTKSSCVLSAKDQDAFRKALDKIDVIRSRTEDNMFRDYPELPVSGINVFYGPIGEKPRSDMDEEVKKAAKRIIEELWNVNEMSKSI